MKELCRAVSFHCLAQELGCGPTHLGIAVTVRGEEGREREVSRGIEVR